MPVSKKGHRARYASRTSWLEAIREVPSTWLEDEAKHSPSPHSLLAAWKGERGVPAHVMLTLLRRRLREHNPELMQTTFPATRLQRTQDMLKAIWARAGAAGGKHPTWRLVDGLLRMAREYMDADRSTPDRSQPRHDQGQ